MNIPTLAIYGSCVARDIVRVTEDRFSLSGYIARQNWISAFSEPIPAPREWGVRSNFQAKNLKGDFSSDATVRLRELGKKSDMVIMDLASEQHGVFEWEAGRFVSATPTIRASDFYKSHKRKKHIPFGSLAHIDLFRVAADKMKDFLQSEDLFDKTLVLTAPFTDDIVGGGKLEKRYSAESLNLAFSAYYELLGTRGFALTAPLPADLNVTSEEHQWGAAQDHYIDPAYEWWADSLVEFHSRYQGEGLPAQTVSAKPAT